MMLVWWLAGCLLAPPVGLQNGSFEDDADGDGVPDGWSVSGDDGVVQRLERLAWGDGHVARLTCEQFAQRGPASHAMLAQVGRVTLRAGQWYRFAVRLRGQGTAGGAIQVAVSDTASWQNCGLNAGLVLEDQWAEREVLFRAERDVSTDSRLQLWWTSTGVVWFDDVRLEPVAAPTRRFGEALPAVTARNLIPNGGFEAGAAGWGSITEVPGWGGNLNRLLGEVLDAGAHSGRRCLAVPADWADLPTISFDYFTPFLVRATLPFAAHRGWLEAEPGATYTLSAFVKAEGGELPVLLRAFGADGRRPTGTARAGGDWTRVSFSFQAPAAQIFCGLAPDLREGGLAGGRLLIDDVQLEAGTQPTDAAPRAEVTIGLQPAEPFGQSETAARALVTIANQSAESREVTVGWIITDFNDAPAAEGVEAITVRAGEAAERVIGPTASPRGFYRLTVTADGAEVCPPWPLRLAVLEPNRRDDTLCGMNHAYPVDELLDASRRIGLGWFRDWSYQWRLVEPEPGAWRFDSPDAQVDRVLARDLRVMALLPFPSATWSSTAPGSDGATESQVLGIVARAPRDEAAFAEYVRRTVAHLRGRINVVEIFNEPIYTHYSLPRADGYTPADYVKWLRIAAAAAREANPEVVVVGGIQGGPELLTAEFIAAGGAEPIDALSLHSYPGANRPEQFIPGLAALRARLAAAGRADLPLWWTEGAYYADDDPVYQPYQGNWLQTLPSERLQAAYLIRLNTILAAAGTRRIIYHSGTPGSLNQVDPSGIFFEYDGLPRRVTPALAAFTARLAPDFEFRGRRDLPDGWFVYEFISNGRGLQIAWSLTGGELTVPAGWRAEDLFGNPLPPGPVPLGEVPVYLVE